MKPQYIVHHIFIDEKKRRQFATPYSSVALCEAEAIKTPRPNGALEMSVMVKYPLNIVIAYRKHCEDVLTFPPRGKLLQLKDVLK